jgi:SAM-dependent methyltransferase
MSPGTPALAPEPRLAFADREDLPFLVEHWYFGSRTRRYIILRRIREVLSHSGLRPGGRALELGCGWAFGSLWARRSGAQAVGIDLGLDQLHWARRYLPEGGALDLAGANARSLPFRDASFDTVFSVEMLEHVFRPDRPAVLAEIARVLKPGGTVALSTPNASSPIEVVKRLAVRWPALRRRLPEACFPEAADNADAYHPYHYHHPVTAGELRDGFQRAGLEVLGMKRFLWALKTGPDSLLGVARVMEAVAEALPLVNRLGATTLVWARRPGTGSGF